MLSVLGRPAVVSDPTFTTRAEMEAWARETERAALTAAILASDEASMRRIYTRAIEQIRRVTVAHLELMENADDR